ARPMPDRAPVMSAMGWGIIAVYGGGCGGRGLVRGAGGGPYTARMWVGRAAIAVCLALILGVPFLLRPEPGRQAADLPTLVIVTPHVEQIRREFGAAF